MAAALPHPILHGLLDAQDNFDRLLRLLEQLYDPGDVRLSAAAVVAGSEPSGWLLCDGRPVLQSDYSTLFAALGGALSPWGVGRTTFNVPDFRGRVPVGVGTGSGLTARALAASGGAETHALSTAQLPSHNHGGVTGGMNALATNAVYGAGGGTNFTIHTWAGAFVGNDNNKWNDLVHNHSIPSEGGGASHNNMQPWVAANWLVCTGLA